MTRKHPQTKELPLHIAAKAGRYDIIELLLHYGSDHMSPEEHVNERTSSGATPLELAANQGAGIEGCGWYARLCPPQDMLKLWSCYYTMEHVLLFQTPLE